MGLVEGLANIEARLAQEEAKRNRNDGPKIPFLGLQDGESQKFVFLQEFDKSSENYLDKNGLAQLAVEHQHPENYRTHAQCTRDDDKCYGCEKFAEGEKGWRQKFKLYINVLLLDEKNNPLTDDDGKPLVKVLSQGYGPQSITEGLLEIARELGTVTDKVYKFKRSGKGKNDTSYVLTQTVPHKLNLEEYDVYDLKNDVLKKLPYAEQEGFYNYWRQFVKDSGQQESGLDEFAKRESKPEDVW